jgi:acetoacetyl-CoA synthetase
MNELPIWAPGPARVQGTNLHRFTAFAENQNGLKFPTYADLHRWSLEQPEFFWRNLVNFSQVRGSAWGEVIRTNGNGMSGTQWFPNARFNFAENLLSRKDETDAIIFWSEDKIRKKMSWADLHNDVGNLAAALRDFGIKPGDRIAAVMANVPETIVWFLATASIGAIWSSCSPDFGVDGIVDRFGQIEPRILVCNDGYLYNGKHHDCRKKIEAAISRIPSIETCIIVPYPNTNLDIKGMEECESVDSFCAPRKVTSAAFQQFPFSHPLYILYSSGTTGRPKCIVHSAGGALLTHVKEHQLHCDISPGDKVFYFTTCGWMMWNWLVSALASKATVLLFDGSPFHPTPNILFDYADQEKITFLGTSAKFFDALRKTAFSPAETHNLSSLKTIASTGSPLAPTSFDYVYKSVKPDVHLASIAGGTDIVGCFMTGIPTEPVWRGEIQGPALGMATKVFDEDGNACIGTKGELVCTKAFPSMPVKFWNDPKGKLYHNAYFAHFPGVWRHGDWVEKTQTGGFIIHGRSDTTLNPGGVRIGTGEIYRQVEQLQEVLESVAIGQEWDNDVRIILFVILQPNLILDQDLMNRIIDRIRKHCSPRHVPAKILQVDDIPRTKSGKVSELAVREAVHGRQIQNLESMENPGCLNAYEYLEELNS